ncbi:alpha-amylase family glycosyl hydrolase [Candidatus Saccharibacteria bacterium]|nr:alpha-amylase family glycosyl hydrolase [Candidatus Saccharibacteria bacterium]
MAKRALIYQIYPASFGDLKFIASKIPEIAENIGPDYIWLNPFFKSPWWEGGYDVADYEAIDPRFGTMTDFKALLKVAKQYKIKILLDLVLNHTSDQHEWFQKSRYRDPWYSDYYVWLDKQLNWQSFFGGPAFKYDQIRGQYYLHLFHKSQPDLNFSNPRVIKEFQKIIKFWADLGVAGFRVDSANVLSESKFVRGYLPRVPGFFNYFQTQSTVKVLNQLFSGKMHLFNLAEPVGGDFLSRRKFQQLTCRAFDASFNIGILDAADTRFSDKSHPLPLDYKRWFKKLATWTPEPKLSFALESHDTPRAPSRFKADPKVLAMLQFLLPSNYPCVYQGQEIGTPNPKLGDKIEDYPGVQSRSIYRQLLNDGKTEKAAMQVIQQVSRDNARQPLDWKAYVSQTSDPKSVLNFYKAITELWRTDPVINHGKLKVKKITKSGIFDFERRYGNQTYRIHLDFSSKTKSILTDSIGNIILSS